MNYRFEIGYRGLFSYTPTPLPSQTTDPGTDRSVGVFILLLLYYCTLLVRARVTGSAHCSGRGRVNT